MAQLVSLEAAKAYLGVTGTADDTAVSDAVTRASALCEQKLGRPIGTSRRENERLRGTCSPKLYPKVRPIDPGDTITVIVNGVEQTVWTREADGVPESFDVQLLADDPAEGPSHFWRGLGWAPIGPTSPQNVVLSYTGGWPETPDQFREACLLIVQKVWRDQKRALADVATITGPEGSISMLDAWIPRRARELLEYDRTVRVI